MIDNMAPGSQARSRGNKFRTLKIASALAASLLVAGCASAAGGNSGTGEESDPTAYMLLPAPQLYVFFNTLYCNMKEKAPEAGLDVTYQDVKADDTTVAGYTRYLEQAQAKGPDAIITGIPDAAAMDSTLEQMKDDGFSLITYDQVIEDDSIPDAQVLTDTYETGVIAAQEMARLTDEQGQFLIIDYGAGNPSTNQRTNGFVDEVTEKYPNMEILPVQYDGADPTKTAQIIDSTLAKYPDLTGIWFTYSVAGVNGIPSVMAAAEPGEIIAISSDADPALVEYLEDGYIQTLLPQNAPAIADALIERTLAAIAGEEIDPVTLQVPPVAITLDNLDEPESQAALYKSECSG